MKSNWIKKKWYKTISLLLCAVLMINTLSGCGTSKEKSAARDTSGAQETVSQTISDVQESEVSALADQVCNEIERGKTIEAKASVKALSSEMDKVSKETEEWLASHEKIENTLSQDAKKTVRKRRKEFESTLAQSKKEAQGILERLEEALAQGDSKTSKQKAEELEDILTTADEIHTYGTDGSDESDRSADVQEFDISQAVILSEDAVKKAEELKTPLNIYTYLKNNINYEFYGGSRKGASGTFASLGGNDLDQASLLIAMLRHLGYEAEFVSGIIKLEKEQALSLTGAKDMRIAAEILASGGKAVSTVTSGGEIVSIRTEHVWVRAGVPYTDYRGSGNAEGDIVWVDLDTGIKQYDHVTNLCDIIDKDQMQEQLFAVSGNSLPEAMDEFVEGQQQQIAEEVGGWISLRSRIISYTEDRYLPLELQYQVVEETETFSQPAQSMSDQITFVIAGENFGTFTSAEILGKEVLLSYVPADETEQEIYDSYSELFDIPAYAVKMVPVLTIDGEVLAKGSAQNSYTLGEKANFVMTLYSGGENEVVENSITCGSMYSVTFDAQSITASELEDASDALLAAADSADISNVYSTGYLGKLLSLAGKQYFAQLDIANMIAMELYDVQADRRLSAGMTGYEVRCEYLYGQLSGISEGSLYIDIDANTMTTTALDGKKDKEREFMAVTGMMSSLYESVVWEQLTGIESVSTMSLLGLAPAEGIDICILTKENLSSELDTLSVSDSLKEEIRAEVASGKLVVIPKQELSVADWNGTGYIIMDAETGAGAYMISGGLTGGEIGGGAVTGVVTLEMLLGMVCSAYVEVVLFAGIAAIMQTLASATLVTAIGGYIAVGLAIVSTYYIFAKTYELILAYTDYMATGDLNSAYDVFRIAYELGMEALVSAIMVKLNAAYEKSGNGGGNSGGGNSDFSTANSYGIDMENLNFSNTVQNHTGRTYQNLKHLINEIIESKPPVPDSRGTNALSWTVEGTYNESTGYYELIIDPITNTVWHFVFKSQ